MPDPGRYRFASTGAFDIDGRLYPYVLYKHSETHRYHALPLCLAVTAPPSPETPGRRIYDALYRIERYFHRVHKFTPRFRGSMLN